MKSKHAQLLSSWVREGLNCVSEINTTHCLVGATPLPLLYTQAKNTLSIKYNKKISVLLIRFIFFLFILLHWLQKCQWIWHLLAWGLAKISDSHSHNISFDSHLSNFHSSCSLFRDTNQQELTYSDVRTFWIIKAYFASNTGQETTNISSSSLLLQNVKPHIW